MYRKPHHKFLQNFSVVDVSQVAMCVSSQISERVIGEGSFAKSFAMSSDSQFLIYGFAGARVLFVSLGVIWTIQNSCG
jgi:hypothetical protein